MTKALERNEDILRLDPKSGLGTLARETGGFLVSDTNDIARSLRVAEEDLASYYLLEYAPGNELWDGRFRRIEVKVRRPGVSVQARQGYFAVRTPLPTPLLDYESPVLAALEMAPRANDFAFVQAVAQVPDQADESAVPVLVEVAGDVPTLDLDAKAKQYRQDFTVLVLVRDAAGQGGAEAEPALRDGGPPRQGGGSPPRAHPRPPRDVAATRELHRGDGSAGRCLRPSRRAAHASRDPGPAEALRVSSLVIVGHAAPRGRGPSEAPALVAQAMQLYPNAAGPVSASSGRPLPFFLVASPAAGRDALARHGRAAPGRTPVFSAPAEFARAVGRATLLGGVPLDGIAPGDYELRVTVADGVDRAVRWAKVTIAP